MGALGYCIGVIGCVLLPGVFLGARKLGASTAIAAPIALVVGVYAGGVVLLFFDMAMFDNVETHAIAIAHLNDCDPATAALGSPIELTGTGGGTYESQGAFGTSSWQIDVAGPRRGAEVVYAAEKHGGVWSLTALAMKLDDAPIDLRDCMQPRRALARSLPHVDRAALVGLWGEQHGDRLMLTRLAADGTFVAAGFTSGDLQFVVRGTWELSDGGIVWRYDKARSRVPDGYWSQMSDERIRGETNPIVELSPSKLVYQELDRRLTELVPMDPARLEPLLRQLDAR
jgi:hypothetical protein